MSSLTVLSLNDICRFCLMKNSEMSSVFAVPLPSKITSILPFEIFEGDGLPPWICSKCCSEVERSCKFKAMCLDSDAALRQCMGNKPTEPAGDETAEREMELQLGASELAPVNFCTMLPWPGWTERLSEKSAAPCKPPMAVRPGRRVRRSRNKQALNEAMTLSKEEDEGPPFVCPICTKPFFKRDNLKKHEIIHRGDKPYLCEECGKSFARKQDLNVHRRYHSGVRPYPCSLCDKTFHSYSGLKSHENRHNGVKPFLCNICGKTFVQKSQLTNHERVHSQEKPYSCTLCEKAFTTLTNLKTHQKRHTGVNEFSCATCGKAFFTKSGLERHELLHTGHKAFACELCNLAFFTKSEITRHMRYHKGEKRFACHRCDKRFIENQHLVIHERIHSGERPYRCQLCSKAFYTKSKLNRHMRTHSERSLSHKLSVPTAAKPCEPALSFASCLWGSQVG